MQLRIGDRLVDESGEWQVLAKPYTTAGGKSVNVRVQRADNSNSAYGARTSTSA
jgi:hypothetical protein